MQPLFLVHYPLVSIKYIWIKHSHPRSLLIRRQRIDTSINYFASQDFHCSEARTCSCTFSIQPSTQHPLENLTLSLWHESSPPPGVPSNIYLLHTRHLSMDYKTDTFASFPNIFGWRLSFPILGCFIPHAFVISSSVLQDILGEMGETKSFYCTARDFLCYTTLYYNESFCIWCL